jgi:hypothetical protein
MRWIAILFLSALCSRSTHADTFTLSNDTWRITVDPQTLAASGEVGQVKLSLSSAQAPARFSRLVHQPSAARWFLDDSKTWISMRLEADTLRVLITADDNGDFSWPLLSPEQSHRAFILPIWEGSYVPADDADWIKHLASESPINVYGLSLPLWGIDCGGHTLTYMIPNPFNSELVFTSDHENLAAKLLHHFVPANDRREYEVMISLGPASPIEPALRYRRWLIEQNQFVSLQRKIEKTPDTAKLLGAAHVYLWGGDALSRYDVSDWKKFAAAFVRQAKQPGDSFAKRVWNSLDDESKKLLEGLPNQDWADAYTSGAVARGISAGLSKVADGPAALHAAFPDLTTEPKTWGDGVSTKMLAALSDAKLDRLWLGADGAQALIDHPNVADRAKELGYLIGYYDSYHSIHLPNEKDTWSTAQFDQHLFDTGGIMKPDGTFRGGFKQKGHLLSPLAAKPYVEQRVREQMATTHANSIFIDCDAFGEVFDDYSPNHRATQRDDVVARVARLRWMRDTFNAVVGSEGGVWYAADTIHFAHGMTTGVIGWGDKDLADKQSPYFLGGYFPPDGPAVFFKPAPMKDAYIKLHVDPRFRLPLYEAAFHDSVISTHHWSASTLKYSNVFPQRVATELLYNVPPLYHLNLAEWKKRKEFIAKQYAFFSPLHRTGALSRLNEFKWLTPDHLVQQTTFEGELEMTANFGEKPYRLDEHTIVRNGVLTRRIRTGEITIWNP